jgi:integrase
MARKRKNQLPSGSFRKQVYIGKDEAGKKKYISFTAYSKEEVERLARQYKDNHTNTNYQGIKVCEAIDRYIDLRSATLSPTTIKNYKSILEGLRKKFPVEMHMPIEKFSADSLQIMINNLLKTDKQNSTSKLSNKTVRNRVGLITSSLEHCGIVLTGYRLPTKKRPNLYVPSDEEMHKLFDASKGTDMEVPILLAAFGPMRCGEVLGVRKDAIKGNVIHVFRTQYYGGKDVGEQLKDLPKTLSSNRFIQYPDSVIASIKKNGLPELTHKQIDQKFGNLLTACGLPHFRFHDLRHWCISTLHAQGMPDQYIMQRSGHSSLTTLQAVYRHTLADQNKLFTEKALEHFDSML